MNVCDTSRKLQVWRPCLEDRLSSLPDDLLSQILSKLPTKDVAVVYVLSKTMRRRAFSVLTTVDFDDHDSVKSHRYLLFVSFVDRVLKKLSCPLSRFRLHVGMDHSHESYLYEYHSKFPDLAPSRLNKWFSYPLRSHVDLTELDFHIHVAFPSDHQIPPALFACKSLRVLKLDSNLKLDGAKIPVISLPNLNLLHLCCLHIADDAFITRLVSASPFLEDLTITNCWWAQAHRLSISSPSLKRLVLCIDKSDAMTTNDVVHIDTPNLEYFLYDDNLAFSYTVTYMNALVEATVGLWSSLGYGSWEDELHRQLTLVRMLSNATHLSLLGHFLENMYYGGELKNQLPVFRNLKTLELPWCPYEANGRWDEVVMETLLCTPNLEALTFHEGFFDYVDKEMKNLKVLNLFTETTPQCLLTHLKQIVIKDFCGEALELNAIEKFLDKASILQELVIVIHKSLPRNRILLLERTLKEIPRASISCSIRLS